MSRDEVHKLLGGYATGTLTPDEQQALFEAALEDQSLFDQLAKEQPLQELLADRSARAQLLASLDRHPEPWYRRWASWGLPAAATAVIVAGLLVWRVNQKEARPTEVAQVMQPAATAPGRAAERAVGPAAGRAAERPVGRSVEPAAEPAPPPASTRANEQAPADPAVRALAGKPRAAANPDSDLKTANQPVAAEKDKGAAAAAASTSASASPNSAPGSGGLRDAKAESARRAVSAPVAVSGIGGGVVGGVPTAGPRPAAPPPPPLPQPSAVAGRAGAVAGSALSTTGQSAAIAGNGFLPSSATLAGVVMDPTGAALSGADVKVFSLNGNTPVASAKTGSRGEFAAPLSAGVYQLEVLAPGFQSYRGDVVLDGANKTPLPITLQVGTSTETVVLMAQAGVQGSLQAGSQQAAVEATSGARQRAQAQPGNQISPAPATTVKILRKQPDGSVAEAKPDDLRVGDNVTFEITPNSGGLLTLTENSSALPLVNRAPVQAGKPFDAPTIVLTAAGVRQFSAQIDPAAVGRGGGGGGGRGAIAGFGSARGGLAKSAKKQEPESADALSAAPILIRITVR